MHSPAFLPPRHAWLLGQGGRRGAAAAVLALAFAALAGAAALAWQRHAADTAAAHQRSRDLPPPVAARPAPAATLSAAERARLNRIVRRLNTPWPDIFEALESQPDPKVALLSLETDAERGAVRVQTEGPSLEALLQHSERVQAAPPFARTRLLRIEPPEAASAPAAGGATLTRLSFDLVIR